MSRLPFVSLLLLCVSCAAGQPAAPVFRTPQSTQAARQQVQASPAASPTIEPTATSGAEATAQSAQATSDAARLVVAAYTAQYRADSATQAAESAQRTEAAYSLDLTADSENRAAGATSQSIQATQQVQRMTATADGMIFAARVPTIIAAATAATYTAARETAQISLMWLGGIAAVLIGVVLLIAIVRLIPMREAEYATQLDPLVIAPAFHADPAPAAPYTSLHVRTIPAGVPEAVLLTFAQHVALSDLPGGDPFTRAEWVDSGKMTRPQWSALLYFLADNQYTRPINPGVANSPLTFTVSGEAYLKRFRDEKETSPTREGLS